MKTINQKETVSFEKLVQFQVLTLKSTDQNPFWFTNNKFEKRFEHETAKAGARFVDANNGDNWRVIASDAQNNRLVVQNLSQDWQHPKIVIW